MIFAWVFGVAAFFMFLFILPSIIREQLRKEVVEENSKQFQRRWRLTALWGAKAHHWRLYRRVEKHYRRARKNAPDHHCTYRGNLEAIRQGLRHEQDQLDQETNSHWETR